MWVIGTRDGLQFYCPRLILTPLSVKAKVGILNCVFIWSKCVLISYKIIFHTFNQQTMKLHHQNQFHLLILSQSTKLPSYSTSHHSYNAVDNAPFSLHFLQSKINKSVFNTCDNICRNSSLLNFNPLFAAWGNLPLPSPLTMPLHSGVIYELLIWILIWQVIGSGRGQATIYPGSLAGTEARIQGISVLTSSEVPYSLTFLVSSSLSSSVMPAGPSAWNALPDF